MAELQKQISLGQGTAMLLTTLLGTGAFVVPALAATAAGSHSLWAWILMLLLILPIAITFGLLGASWPHAGGTAYLLAKAFGKRWEKYSGWLYLSIIPIGLPAALAIATGYLGHFLGLDHQFDSALAFATLGLLLVVSLSGVKAAGNLQLMIAVVVALCLGSLITLSDMEFQSLVPPPFEFSMVNEIGQAMAVIFWCFMGIEAMSHMGAEFRNPKRDFPLTIILSLLLTAAFYYLTASAVLHYGSYGDSLTDSRSVALIAEQIYGAGTARFVSLIGFLACFASMNLYCMSFGRLVYSMASDGPLPSKLAKLNRQQQPATAILAVFAIGAAALAIQLLSGIQLSQLISFADGVFATIYLMAMLAGYHLLKGPARKLALVSAILSALVLIAIGWYMAYTVLALAICFACDFNPLKRKRALPQD